MGKYAFNQNGVARFYIKYKMRTYHFSSVTKWFIKIVDLIKTGCEEIQFDDIELLRVFNQLFAIEDMVFTPSKNRIPHYVSNITGEKIITRGVPLSQLYYTK